MLCVLDWGAAVSWEPRVSVDVGLAMCRMLTLRQEGLLSMALQKLVWTGAVHAIGMTKGGCRLNPFYTQLILSGVNFPLVLRKLASVKWLRVSFEGSLRQVPWNDTEAALE